MFKVKNKLAPQTFHNSFEQINHNFPTRFRENNLRQPRIVTQRTSFAISKRGPRLWNNFLDGDLKKLTSLCVFKQCVKNFIAKFENEVTFF